MSSNLPLVGAHAVLLGVNAFQQNARSIIFQLNEVNAVTSKLGRDSERHYQAAASAAQRHASVVAASATKTISAYSAATKAQEAALAEAKKAEAQVIAAVQAENAAQAQRIVALAAVTKATNDLTVAQGRLAAAQKGGLVGPWLMPAQQGIAQAQRRVGAANAGLQTADTAIRDAANRRQQAEADLEPKIKIASEAAHAAALLRTAAAYNVIATGAAQFNAILRTLTANIATFISHSQQAAVVVGGVLAVALASLVGIGVTATKTAATYEDSLTRIQAVTEAPRAQMEQLDATIERIGTTTRVSMSAAAEASEELAKGGLNVADQLGTNALTAVTNLAQASRGELTPALAATAVAVGLNAFQMTDANKVADALVATVQSSSITFSDLRVAMQQAALTAGNLNYTLPQTVAAIGLLGEVGLRGSDAGTSLRTALQHLQKPTEASRKVMNEFGLSLYDAAGRARPLRDVIANLEQAFGKEAVATGKTTEAQRNWALQTIFGTDGARAMLALIEQGVGKFDEFTAAQERLTAQDLANKYMLPLNAQFDLLGNNAQRLATRIGQGLIPVFAPLISSLVGVLQNIPTAALHLFGQTISALAKDSGFGELYKRISGIFPPDVAIRAIAFINVLRNVANAVRQQILPAIGELASAVSRPFTSGGGLQNFVTTATNVSLAVRQAANVVTGFINILTNTVKAVQNNERAVATFITVLKGLAAIPLIGLVTIFGGIAVAIAKAVAVAYLVGQAVNNWDKIQPVVIGIANAFSANLVPILVVATAAMAAFAAASAVAALANFIIRVQAVVTTLGPFIVVLGHATRASALFATTVVRTFVVIAAATVQGVTLMVANLARLVAAFAAARLAAIASFTSMRVAALAAAVGVSVPFVKIIAIAALVAGAVFALAKAWENNFLSIQDITKGVLNFVGQTIQNFVNWISTAIPGAAEIIGNIGGAFSAVGGAVSAGTESAGEAIGFLREQAEGLLATLQEPVDVTSIGEGLTGSLPDINEILAQLEAQNAELQRTTQLQQETAAGANEFGNAGEEAARKYQQALKNLNELFEDTRRRLQNIAEDTAERIATAQQKHQDAWVEAHEEAVEQITEVYRNAAEQIEDMWADLDFSRGQRKQKEALTDEIEEARRARERQREDADRIEDRRLDAVRRSRQEETEEVERQLNDEIEAEERAANRSVQIEETAQRKRNQIAQDNLRERQDAERRALSETFDAANRARSAGRDEARAQTQNARERAKLTSDLARDLARARTQEERRDIEQRFQERVAELNASQQAEAHDRAQRRAEEEQEAAQRKAQEAAERALRAKHDAEERGLKEKQDQDDMNRRFAQDDAEYERRRANDKRLREWKKQQDAKERAEREKEEDAGVERRRKLDDKERSLRIAEDKRMQALEDQLEEEALTRRENRINQEAEKRVAAINASLAKKQAAIDAQLVKELAAIQRNLDDQLRALRQQWEDKIPEIIALGGAAIEPEVARLADIFISNLNAVDAVLTQLIKDLQTAVSLQNKIAEEAEDSSGDAIQDATNKAIKVPSMDRGGIVPGPYGKPMLIRAHGQEVILGLKASRALMTAENRVAAMTSTTVNSPSSVQYNYEYNVDAQYSNVQSPASIAMDLRAINAMLR